MDSHEFREDLQQSVIGSSAQFADYSHSSWLLIEIERLLKPLSKEERENTLLEVEEHLRCSRAAMQEMGFDQSTADRETVAMFGSPNAFAKNLLRRPTKDKSAPRVLLTTMVLTVALPLSLAFLMVDAFLQISYIIFAIGGLAFVIESWRARHCHWKSLAAVGGVLTMVFALAFGFAWVEMWSNGGMGESPRWQLKSLESMSEQQITAIQRIRVECSPIRETFAQGLQAVKASPYYRNNHYEVFVMGELAEFTPGASPTYNIRWTRDYDEAAHSWKNYGGYSRWMEDALANAEAQIPAIDLASRRSFDWMTASQGLVCGAFSTSFALLINFIVSSLRWIYDRLRRLPRRRTA